jgi:serine/threonine-protein kinase
LERVLGSGSMGTVFRARDLTAGRDVAVKVLRHEHALDGPRLARFVREAKAADMVRHPNVVEARGHGVDTASGTPFIVHELLEGRTLAAYLAKAGRLPVDEALGILVPVVEAMAHAHACGVIHRDLNPANIFLAAGSGGAGPTPKVLDFGVSKITAEGRSTASVTGMLMGTPAYMPPEQVRSATAADARADVWAIGVILFEMVAGRLPFVETETSSMFVAICTTTAPRLSAVVPGLPETLAAFVERCLRPKREERFADAGEALAALVPIRDAVATRDRGPRAGGRALAAASGGRARGFVIAIAAAVLLALAWLLWRGAPWR